MYKFGREKDWILVPMPAVRTHRECGNAVLTAGVRQKLKHRLFLAIGGCENL